MVGFFFVLIIVLKYDNLLQTKKLMSAEATLKPKKNYCLGETTKNMPLCVFDGFTQPLKSIILYEPETIVLFV